MAERPQPDALGKAASTFAILKAGWKLSVLIWFATVGFPAYQMLANLLGSFAAAHLPDD